MERGKIACKIQKDSGSGSCADSQEFVLFSLEVNIIAKNVQFPCDFRGFFSQREEKIFSIFFDSREWNLLKLSENVGWK